MSTENEPPSTQRYLQPQAIEVFSDSAKQAVYDVIGLRRDIRHFKPDEPVADATLTRILQAAHQAPSVGLSQPWGFIVVRDRNIRTRIHASFERCRKREADRYTGARREAYLAHRLEGILEAPLNICITADLRERKEAVLGTTAQPETLKGSAYCAVQNLWLAARAEGIGVGWVSIVEPGVVAKALALPRNVEPIAYVCVGHPQAFRTEPMLEETGWSCRRPLQDVLHRDTWQEDPALTRARSAQPIRDAIRWAAAPPPRQYTLTEAFGNNKLSITFGALARMAERAIFVLGAASAVVATSLELASTNHTPSLLELAAAFFGNLLAWKVRSVSLALGIHFATYGLRQAFCPTPT